jgi:hypothetical protein
MRLMELLLSPFVWFCVPLCLALVFVMPIWLTRRRTLVAWLRVISLGFVVLGVSGTAFWSCFFKDGLAPGFIPSTGWTALLRFWEGFAIPLAIAATEALAIIVISRRRLGALRATASAATK